MTQALQRYTEPQIAVALEALAFNSGNVTKTVEQLSEEGWRLSKGRLTRWARKDYPERYRQARMDQLERVKEVLADGHHAAAMRDLEVEEKVTQRLEARLEAGELTENGELALKGKAGLGSAIHSDKGQMLEGEPTVRVQTDVGQMLQTFEKKWGAKLVWPGEELDGTAEEIAENE